MSTQNLQVGSAGPWRPAHLARHGSGAYRRGLGVASAVLLALSSGAALAADPAPDAAVPNPPPPPATLGPGKTVVVKDTALEDAKLGLDEISGGTSLVTAADVEEHRAATQADLLAGQPGVFVQAAGGEDAIKISIRGSGLNRGTGFFRSGVLFTFDGLPVTGPSGTPFELFEPLGLQYTEILRGGNALDRKSVV